MGHVCHDKEKKPEYSLMCVLRFQHFVIVAYVMVADEISFKFRVIFFLFLVR